MFDFCTFNRQCAFILINTAARKDTDFNDSPGYEMLAKNDVGGSMIATPAIADGGLFIRTRTKLLGIIAGERRASAP